MIPDRRPEETIRLRDCVHAIAIIYGVGRHNQSARNRTQLMAEACQTRSQASLSNSIKLIVHVPGGIPSNRTLPELSSVPCRTDPSLSVALYCLPPTGFPSISTRWNSTQVLSSGQDCTESGGGL